MHHLHNLFKQVHKKTNKSSFPVSGLRDENNNSNKSKAGHGGDINLYSVLFADSTFIAVVERLHRLAIVQDVPVGEEEHRIFGTR
jgi:hypothetical protein